MENQWKRRVRYHTVHVVVQHTCCVTPNGRLILGLGGEHLARLVKFSIVDIEYENLIFERLSPYRYVDFKCSAFHISPYRSIQSRYERLVMIPQDSLHTGIQHLAESDAI
jgi:hypothetical protein